MQQFRTTALQFKHKLWALSKRLGTTLVRDSVLSREEIFAAIQRAFANQRGLCLAKMGGTEMAALYQAYFRFNKMKMKESLFELSGVFPSDSYTVEQWLKHYLDHSRRVDILAPTDFSLQALLVTNRLLKPSVITDYRFLEPRCTNPTIVDSKEYCYLQLFKDKRVLIVNPIASLLKSRANQTTYEQVWGSRSDWWFPKSIESLDIPSALDSNVRAQFTSYFKLLEHAESAMEAQQESFDVALIGAGAYAIPLAVKASSLGKVAIAMGGHLQIVFGVYGRRWIADPRWTPLINEHWIRPEESLRPSDYKKTEDGAYW